MLKIIGRASSINVRKVLWTCHEIGLDYEFDDNWGEAVRDARRGELMALNPNDQFPVIIDDSGILWESNTICRYLAAVHCRTDLLPETPRARASVEQWMDWQVSELNVSWRYAFMALVRKAPEFNDPKDIEAGIAAWNGKMAILDRQLQLTGAFITGEDFTLADIVLGLSVNRWMLTPMERPDYAAVAAYYERLSERPGFLAHGRNGTP